MLLRQLLAVPVGRSRTMDARTRLGWVELYQEIGNAGELALLLRTPLIG
jgi:hypothetical protein